MSTTDQHVAGFLADHCSTQRQTSRTLSVVELAVEDANRAIERIRRDLDDLQARLDLDSVDALAGAAREWTGHAGYSGTLEAQGAQIRASLAVVHATIQGVID